MNSNIRKLLISMMILAMFSLIVMSTASAYTDMRITSDNLNILKSFTNSEAWYTLGDNKYMLKWYGEGQYFSTPYKTYTYAGIVGTKMSDYQNLYPGQCVSFANSFL